MTARAPGWRRRGSVALPLVVATALLSGCVNDETAPAAATLGCPLPAGPVVVAGVARTGVPAGEPGAVVQSAVEHALADEQYLAVYDTDGRPTKLFGETLSSAAANDVARKADVDGFRSRVLGGIAGSAAGDAEADPLAALDAAAREVRSQSSAGTVVLVDSGLQTSGALQYQSGDLLLAAGSDVVTHLEQSRQLPDLTGVTVILSGIGGTAVPQPMLDLASQSRLEEQWTAIATAGGAACVHLDEQPRAGEAAKGLPAVAVVSPPKVEPPSLRLDAPVALREDVVGFEDNSAELREPEAARQSLQALAEAIVEGQHSVVLTGTTATAGTEQGRAALSLARAEAVKQLLVDAGVAESAVQTRGVGTDHPAHVDDLDADGNLIPAKAIQNRAVFVSVNG